MVIDALDRWLASLTNTPPFAFRFWDGTVKRYGQGEPVFVVVIKNASVLPRFMSDVALGFGEAYMHGEIEVEGSLEELLHVFHAMSVKQRPYSLKSALVAWLIGRGLKNRLGQAQKNIRRHYDIGNDFYRLWLGKERLYSCAYFKTADDSIDQAQGQKLEHICRKLFLKPGETLLDIGCGWGGLIIHAAKYYGVSAHGITLSQDQYDEATRRIAAEGRADRVTVEIVDYRELAARGRQFDKISSIGMFEHVGRDNMKTYFDATDRLMKPGAVGLLHTIGTMRGQGVGAWTQKYIFPGAYLPGLRQLTRVMANFPFRIVDIENLRPHYALTLDHWHQAFEANVDTIRKMYSEEFVRMWRLYLVGSAAGFRYGRLDLWQIQFTKGLRNDLPLTRDYLYQTTPVS